MDGNGERLASRWLHEGIDGIGTVHGVGGEYAEDPDQVLVGIETDRGLWVSALVAAGYRVHAVNPKAASRYRERHHVAGGKSDRGDAKMLADLVRTDAHNHRQVAGEDRKSVGQGRREDRAGAARSGVGTSTGAVPP